MEVTTQVIRGDDAIRLLTEHRSRYATTGLYPFLIGDGEELQRIQETDSFNRHDPAAIVAASCDITPTQWIAGRRRGLEEDGLSGDEFEGVWPGELLDKGSIGLHKDIVTDTIHPAIYMGFARIAQPWHLPAALKFGGWNDCPHPDVHCAFHRHWQERHGAEITGMSGDVIECVVRNPPDDREAAITLAWEQYWYCADVVEQGIGSVSHLAATLLNSPYWFFWWD